MSNQSQAMVTYLDAGFKFCCSVVVALLLCSVLPTLAQTQADFLNIDCGATAPYVDQLTGFTWVPDGAYISTGTIATPLLSDNLSNFTELNGLRYFDDFRPKNCYALPVTASSAYLLRATFYYGNYDNKNQVPSFQLAIDATILENVTALAGNDALYVEYHFMSQGNVTYVCLIRTSSQFVPFVSGISLKPASALSTGYATQYNAFLSQGVFMKTRLRANYGGTQMIRAPDDFYDRFWFPEGPTSIYLLNPATSAYEFLSTASPFVSLVDQKAYPPSTVMQTAVTSNGTITSLLLPEITFGTATSWYASVYYGELINYTGTPIPRNFTIQVLDRTGTVGLSGAFAEGFYFDFWNSGITVGPNSTMTMTPLASSLAGPILNAMEVFAQSDPAKSKTVDRDALAIEDVKTRLNLTEWTGDPCLPFPHSWIACSSPDETTPQPQITAVNLSGYQLEGALPDSFANLWALTSLSVDNNSLSGPLPAWLTSLTSLKVLSIQNNNFSGTIPNALLSANSPILFTYRPGNLLLVPGGSCTSNCGKKTDVALIVGASIGGVLGLILILVIAIVAYRRCQRKGPKPSDDEGASIMRIATTGGAKAYTLSEVKVATNHFNRELGKGGFGPVYYGLFPDGQEVAVKVADGSSKQGEKEFFNEVDVLSRVHHKNLVALVGYCQEQQPILIYEYMHNGSLFDHLHGTAAKAGKLNWKMRLHIALNAAQGLEYLHTGCSPSFIHRDVKSSNILLTPKYDAKVADFGLTKLMGEPEDTRVMTKVMGTAGYLDPEYYTTQYISSKSDVYSFGIVLLELITGRLPIEKSAFSPENNSHIVQWVRESFLNNDINSVLDPLLKASNPNMEAVWKVADIAMQSVEPKGAHRPTMAEVFQELQGALTIEGMPTTEFLPEFLDTSSKYDNGPSSFPMPR